MTIHQLPVGDSFVALEIPSSCRVRRPTAAGVAMSPEWLRKSLHAALQDPVDYPSLSDACFPDDRIVLAVEAGLPEAGPVVAAVLSYLLESGVSPARVQVLLASEPGLRLEVHNEIQRLDVAIDVREHHARDRSDMAYLAADRAARPVYLNRALCDADLVMTIGCLRCPSPIVYGGLPGGVFPAFSDEASQIRFARRSAMGARKDAHRLQQQANEAQWLFGARFGVLTIPAAQEGVCRVLAGDRERITEKGREAYEQVWNSVLEGFSRVVVATLTGGQRSQTWDNVVRCLECASRVATEDAAIVLCTKVAVAPPEDCPVPRDRVYMMSDVEADAIEAQGITPIRDVHEIANLCRKSDSCILLDHAQFRWPESPQRAIHDTVAR